MNNLGLNLFLIHKSCDTVWLSGCLAVWLYGCLAVRLFSFLAVWLFGCLANRLSGFLSEHEYLRVYLAFYSDIL